MTTRSRARRFGSWQGSIASAVVPEMSSTGDRATGPKVKVGSTGNKPEIVDRVKIARANQPSAKGEVILSLGANSNDNLPLPNIKAGDRLRIFVELEVTTDYEDASHPGLIGNAYSYAPRYRAALLVAKGAAAKEARPGRAKLIGDPTVGEVRHDHHHRVIVFGDFGLEADELDWSGSYYVNVVLSAAHPKAHTGDVLLVGQNEKTPVVVRDMAGIRVVRLRPGTQPAQPPERTSKPLRTGIPVNRRQTTNKVAVVVYSHELSGLTAGEQLLVKARLNTDAAALGYATRISTRLFLADSPQQTEPGGHAQKIASWNGHLSKLNGFNCLRDDGVRASQKFGVLSVKQTASKPLYVNLVAVSSDPFGGAKAGDKLPVEKGSFLEVTRYPSERNG